MNKRSVTSVVQQDVGVEMGRETENKESCLFPTEKNCGPQPDTISCLSICLLICFRLTGGDSTDDDAAVHGADQSVGHIERSEADGRGRAVAGLPPSGVLRAK